LFNNIFNDSIINCRCHETLIVCQHVMAYTELCMTHRTRRFDDSALTIITRITPFIYRRHEII